MTEGKPPVSLDRAAKHRKDRDSLNRMLADPHSLLFPVWRDQNFVCLDPEVLVPELANESPLLDAADEIAWLGMRGDTPCFAVDLSSVADPHAFETLRGLGTFADLRMTAHLLAETDVAVLAYARAMLHWHRQQRYCGRCGQATEPKEGGHLRECSGCRHKHFPRTDPAVLVLISDGARCVLAHQPNFPQGMYSTLAGFVEPGESLEQAVEREVFEEVGLTVQCGKYRGSQPWPFPQSLMLGFRAQALTHTLCIDTEEISDARWFTRDELQNPRGFFTPPPFSLAHRLIAEFLAED
ncbi:MAG TPA: NAD(+) diphosphatase [Polyangiaceae bacterium]|nr:NAD(+) diphosphatase [Polyangiaceae bacterium]